MKCLVCHSPQPGPHKMSCRPSEREAAARSHGRTSSVRAAWLHAGSTPWGEKPTVGAMLARLDAFCARYAEACGDPDKAAKVRALMIPKIGGMYA